MDSDSDNDILTNNVCTFRPMNTTVSATGPNISNVASLSFRNHIPHSSMYMPRNMQHSRYASSMYDQRSIHSRREMSPMSVQSAYDFQPRNLNMSRYRGMSSQRSVMNGRSESPMSMTSTTSVSAIDIAMALKNSQFSKDDVKIISEACNKFMKYKIRKKFERRRNRRMYLKGGRHRSGGESGEQGSDSSLSNDDCRSNRTSIFKENMSSCRSTKLDLTNIKKTLQDSNMYNDCSANLKKPSLKNMFPIGSGSLNSNMSSKSQNVALQKDRFKSGFLLPSQRFNKSVASTIPETMEKQQGNISPKTTLDNFYAKDNRSKNFMSATDSENDEIFTEASNRQYPYNTELQRKRSLDKDEETHVPQKKRNKLSPIKHISDENNVLNENRNSDQSVKNKDDFIFAKPLSPIKKIANLKKKEKLIARSPHIKDIFEIKHLQEQNLIPTIHTTVPQDKEKNQTQELLETTKQSNTDVSMRPSFIKRKLFTQKLDIAENKVLSSDNENSPKTVYGGIHKEKNKARKLVTNQSCLSRDVHQDDNYLDLIHKIVPAEQMNSTNQPNKSNTERKSKAVDDKLEFSSMVSTYNNDDVSDTYTDEDIFLDNNNTENIMKDKHSSIDTAVNKRNNECRQLLEKVPTLENVHNINRIQNNPKPKAPSNATCVKKNNMKTSPKTKSFWDTDLESDIECYGTLTRMNVNNQPHTKGKNVRAVDQQTKKSEQKPTAVTPQDVSLLNNTSATVNKFNNTSLRIRTHRETKKKKCCEEIDQKNTTLNKTQNQNPASKDLSCLSYTAFENNVKTNNTVITAPELKSKLGRAARSCRTPKQNPKETTESKTTNKTKVNQSVKSRKADLSSNTIDNKSSKTKSRKQNANKKITAEANSVNSRKSDVSFSLNTDTEAVKTKKIVQKNVKPDKSYKPRKSNVSFSISSNCPLTRSRAANISLMTCDSPLTRSRTGNISGEKQKDKRSNNHVNRNENKSVPAVKQVLKTPNKRGGNNAVIVMVHNLKSNKNKSVRKR